MSIKLYRQDTKESLVLVPRYGGTITSLVLGRGLREVLRNDSLSELELNPLFRGRFLFPFNDRIPGGHYSFKGKSYQLPINCFDDHCAIHGFLYRQRIDTVKEKEEKAVLRWRTDETVLPGYPFILSLVLTIELHGGGVLFSFVVKNEGSFPAPFALGWHSYYKIGPSSILEAAYPCYFRTDQRFLPVGDCQAASGSTYDFSSGAAVSGRDLDHTFRAPPDGISRLRRDDYLITITQENFPFTQLFIPPQNDSIAIEPITSKPNAFNTGDVLILEPEEEYSAHIRIEVTSG